MGDQGGGRTRAGRSEAKLSSLAAGAGGLPLYLVDAFAERPFGGNPAAVCLLPAWPEDTLLLAIAASGAMSEPGWAARHHRPAAHRHVQAPASRPQTPALNETVLKTEVLLARAGFSPGAIDARDGDNFANALHAFQQA